MKLPASVTSLIKEAAKWAVIAAPAIAALGAVLPAMHVPAVDVGYVGAVCGAVGAFVKWAKSHGYAETVKRAFRLYR